MWHAGRLSQSPARHGQAGTLIYLVAADINSEGSFISRLWRVDARTGEVLRTWDIQDGMGGGVTPDGLGYVFVDIRNGDTANLVRLNLETGQQEPLTRFEGHLSLGTPSVSPDGQRVVFAMRGPDGWDLALRAPDGSVRWLTQRSTPAVTSCSAITLTSFAVSKCTEANRSSTVSATAAS